MNRSMLIENIEAFSGNRKRPRGLSADQRMAFLMLFSVLAGALVAGAFWMSVFAVGFVA